MKKKFLSILSLCLIMPSTLLFSGCGGNKGGSNDNINVYEVNNEYAEYCDVLQSIETSMTKSNVAQSTSTNYAKSKSLSSGLKNDYLNKNVVDFATYSIAELMEYPAIEDNPSLLNTFKTAFASSFDLPKYMGEGITRYLGATSFFDKTMVLGDAEDSANRKTFYRIEKNDNTFYQIMYMPAQECTYNISENETDTQWLEEDYVVSVLNYTDEDNFYFYTISQNQSGIGQFYYGDNDRNLILVDNLNNETKPVTIVLAQGDLTVW